MHRFGDINKYSKNKNVIEWLVCFLIALIIVAVIKTFVGFPTVVSGASMDPTLKDRQRLWVSKIAIEINKYPEKGDIIIFEAPSTTYITKASANLENPVALYNDADKGFFTKLSESLSVFGSTSYIKRVIGLPGDHVEIKDGSVYLNGEKLQENYLSQGMVTENADGVFVDVVVPDGYVYVLGDNRAVSGDSRRFGCIPIDKIEGKAVLRFWPLNTWSLINKK